MTLSAVDGSTVSNTYTHTIEFEADAESRTATVDFGATVSDRTGQLIAEFNRLKKPEHAAILIATPIKPGLYIIQVAPRGDFMSTVGYFVLAGVSLLEWVRARTEVVETRVTGNRNWSLGGSGRAAWELIPTK